ncbi:hypothetical protein GCM10028808_45580 [Spirosoma migulaei]
MNEGTKGFWEATYKQCIAKMIGLCYRYTYDRQTAEDLAHDAFLLAIDKASSFENKGPFEAWLRRIVINVALQHVREQKKQKDHQDRIRTAFQIPSLESDEESNSNPAYSFSETELLEAISLLPHHHRLVFNLYVFDEFTHAQIGAELGISEGTSKSHLARARKKIRGILTQKANQHPKRKQLLLLLLLPNRLGGMDQLFRRHLNAFELQPQQALPIHTANGRDVSGLKTKPSVFIPQILIKTDLAELALMLTLAIVSYLQLNAYKPMKAPMIAAPSANLLGNKVQSTMNTDTKQVSMPHPTATFSRNTIIARKQTENSEMMKKVNTLNALLLTGSALAFDSTALLTPSQLPIRFINPPVVDNKLTERVRPIGQTQSDTKPNSKKIFGTFYASELFWSAENNELYVRGKHVKVSLNTQKFTGSGQFSFLNKISYLVVNGNPMHINDTIQLSDKSYSLIKLTQAEALEKYGDIARMGAVEITLAE